MEDRLDILDERIGIEVPPENTTSRSLADFLYPSPAPRTTWGIVKWWESRRLYYNLIVGGAGLVSLGAFSFLMSIPPFAHNLVFSWIPIAGFAVLANICYLLGPTAEVFIEKLSRGKILPTGPGLFRMGLTFSVGLALLPTLVAGMDWFLRLMRWIF
jgi:hypothetical protein